MPLLITAIEAEGLGSGFCKFVWFTTNGFVLDGWLNVAECGTLVFCASRGCLSFGGALEEIPGD